MEIQNVELHNLCRSHGTIAEITIDYAQLDTKLRLRGGGGGGAPQKFGVKKNVK
jgi:hypothetical protein